MAGKAKDEPKEDPLPAVLGAIAALQQGHAQGRAILEQFGKQAKQGEIEQAAKEYGRTADAIRKLRQFAIEYSKDDLKDLCTLCGQHRRAIGLSQIYRLVGIKDKESRKALQQEAIVKRWGNGRLFKEMQRRKFTQGHTRGRKRALPKTVPEALIAIEEARRLFAELLEHCAKLAEKSRGKSKERLLAAIKGV